MTVTIETARLITEADADNILFRWGSWVRSHKDLGYGKENSISRLMREGSGACHTAGNNLIGSMPAKVEIAERIILKMERQIQKAIKIKYLARLEDNIAAKACRCNTKEYIARVNKGVSFTANYLNEVA